MVKAKVGENRSPRFLSLAKRIQRFEKERRGGEKRRMMARHGAKTEVARLETVVFRSWRELRATRT